MTEQFQPEKSYPYPEGLPLVIPEWKKAIYETIQPPMLKFLVQPGYSLQDYSVKNFEMLLRIKPEFLEEIKKERPDFRFNPQEFAEVLEQLPEIDRIREFDVFVLESAFDLAKKWSKRDKKIAHLNEATISPNLSSRNLADPAFTQIFFETAKRKGLAKENPRRPGSWKVDKRLERIKIEATETYSTYLRATRGTDIPEMQQITHTIDSIHRHVDIAFAIDDMWNAPRSQAKLDMRKLATLAESVKTIKLDKNLLDLMFKDEIPPMDFVIAHLPGYMPSIEEFLAKGFTVEQNGHLMLRREVTTGAQLREMIIIILTALKNLNPNISVTAEAVDRNENKKILMLKDMKVVDVMQGYMGWEPLEIDDCTPEKLEEGSDRIQAAGSYKF